MGREALTFSSFVSKPDLEDGIIAFAAQRNKVDAIVDRNKRDYALSPVPALTPEEFVSAYKPAGIDCTEELLGQESLP